MSAAEPDLPILRRLASMPFLDRLELAAVSGTADRSAYAAVAALERRGLAASVIHASDLLRATRRYWLTAAGLRRLAEAEGIAPDELLRAYPVSAQRRRILMERLDGVAVIYRLASSIAAEVGPIEMRWYRSAPLDAVITLPGGRIVGVVRQGLTSDRTGFSKRLWRLREGPLPGAVFMLMPDEVRLRHARRLLDGSPVSALLALERDAVLAGPAEPVWRLPSVAASLDLRHVLSSYVERGGEVPREHEPMRATLPEDVALGSPGRRTPDWLLPALLKPAEKRVLDLLHDWLGIAPEHLRGLMGVSRARFYEIMAPLSEAGLVRRVVIEGNRLALSDRGLALLARRDRASVGAARKRWSVELIGPAAPETWRNVSGRRSRQLLRHAEHTAAVHRFIAALAMQSRSLGGVLTQLDPPLRASRHFRHRDRMRSVHPDAFGVLRRGSTTWPFFLEWERRAVRPSTMAERLAPYLRYYSTHRPTDDHGAQPIVLVVFHDELAATHFLRVAQEQMARSDVEVPLLVSHRGLLEREGPLGRAWLAPGGRWEAVHALQPASRERTRDGG